jgi:hypothetical protein
VSVLSASVSPIERRRAREFALLLEDPRPAEGHELESLVALASSLRPADIAPRTEFRTALRELLVAEAAARPVSAAAPRSAGPQNRRHRVRTVVATGVLVSLVGGVGAAAASTHALPGDPLYGLKRGLEAAQLRFDHTDLSRGRDLLGQATSRLSEAETLAASDSARSPDTTARIARAIADLDSATRAGASALEASYAVTGDIEPLLELDRFVVDQRERLADLSSLLGPGLRALLSPLSELLLTMQPHLDSLIADGSATPGAAAGSAGARQGGRAAGKPPLIGTSLEVTDTINALTGGDSTTAGPGVAVSTGRLGRRTAASSLPTPVPRVSLPRPAVPSLPVLSVPAPSLPVVPSVPVLTPSAVPTLPVNVTLPTCVPIPPLTAC